MDTRHLAASTHLQYIMEYIAKDLLAHDQSPQSTHTYYFVLSDKFRPSRQDRTRIVYSLAGAVIPPNRNSSFPASYVPWSHAREVRPDLSLNAPFHIKLNFQRSLLPENVRSLLPKLSQLLNSLQVKRE